MVSLWTKERNLERLLHEVLRPEYGAHRDNWMRIRQHPANDWEEMLGKRYVRVDVHVNQNNVEFSLSNYKNSSRNVTEPMEHAFCEELKRLFGDDCPIRKEEGFFCEYSISLRELERRLPNTKNEILRQAYEHLQEDYKLENAAAGNDGIRWSNFLTRKINEGPYFKTQELLKLSPLIVGKQEASDLKDHLIPSWNSVDRTQEIFAQLQPSTEGDTSLIRNIVKTIKNFGFSRIAYLGYGSSSLAFSTVPDKEGKNSVVLITPENEDRIPTPLLLPALAMEKATGRNSNFLVRVMPYVNTRDVTNDDVLKIIDLVEQSGLEAFLGGDGRNELRLDNIGLLEYTKEDGTHVRLPIVLDWGSVVLPKGADLNKLQARWQTMDVLKPYFEAQEYLKRSIHDGTLLQGNKHLAAHLAAHGVEDTNDPRRLHELRVIRRRHGLAGNEIATLQQHAKDAKALHPDLTDLAAVEAFVPDTSKPVTVDELEPVPHDTRHPALPQSSIDVYEAMIAHSPDSAAARILREKGGPSLPYRG